MLNREASNTKMLAALNAFVARVATATQGKQIRSTEVDQLTGEFKITYTDDEVQNLGVIFGEDGEQGAGVLEVQLYPDPENPTDVYLQTTLTNGVILRTAESLKGWDGKGLASAYIQDNQIHFVLDDLTGTELPPIPVTGLVAISITGAAITEGNLVLTLSNNTTITAGLAADLAGRGVNTVDISTGNLVITYTDDLDTPVDLGKVVGTSVVSSSVREGNLYFQLSDGSELNAGTAASLKGVGVDEIKMENGEVLIKYSNSEVFVSLGELDGVASLSVVNGKLVYTKSSAPLVSIELATFNTVVGMEVVAGELFALTNQPAPGDRINLGSVGNLKGEAGIGISSANISNNVLQITLTDESILDVPITGLQPVSITGARYDAIADEILFILGDGSEIPSGIKEDMRGRGLSNVTLEPTGKLSIAYSDAPATPIELATIKYVADFYVQEGKIYVKYNTAPDTPIELGTILGVTELVSEQGIIKVRYTNGTETILGEIKGIKSVTVDGAANLVITYSDDTTQNAGSVRGPKGNDGVSIIGATIDGSGDLILSTSTGTPINAGQARIDIDNIIGSVKRFVATPGQVVYNVAHSGEAAVFVNGTLLPDSALNLTIGDRISFSPAFTGGEQIVVMAFAPTGSVITGKGIKGVAEVTPGVFEITLENNSKYTINTVTPLDLNALPPRITGMVINASSHLIITFSDASTIDAGFTANANSINTATVDPSGNLILTLTDSTTINCGSVMSNLAISDATINEEGRLIITMNSGGQFDAGVTGVYVVSANIDPLDGHLRLTLNSGAVVDSGPVVNPLLGTFYDFVAFAGQTEFAVTHANHRVLFFANGILLNEARLDLSVPNKVKVLTPRLSGDIIRIVLLSTGGVFVKGIESELTAADNTYYGKVGDVVGFHPIGAVKVSTPFDFVAGVGQAAFNNIPHTGQVEVFINGLLKTTGYTLPINGVLFNPALVGGEQVRINCLTAPAPLGDFVITNYCKVSNQTYENGGTFTGKTWLTRQLNVLESNALALVLDKNNMILPAGSYYIRGWVASYNVQSNAVRLYSNTSRVPVLVSPAQYSEGSSKTFIEGYFSLDTQSSLALQQYGVNSVPTVGLGKCGDGTSSASASQQLMGIPIAHSELHIWKVG